MKILAALEVHYLSVAEAMVGVTVVRKMTPLLGPKSSPDESSLFGYHSPYDLGSRQ